MFGIEQKKRLQRATQLLLKENLDRILRDQGVTSLMSNASTPVPGRRQSPDGNGRDQESSDMQVFIDHARGIFETGLERHMAIHEMKQQATAKGDPVQVHFSLDVICCDKTQNQNHAL